MSHKISGHCTLCDAPCFEVMAVWGENERYPGEPKRLGPPTDDATRITFLLLDGTRADLTFCGECASSLDPQSYSPIWRKVIASWTRELNKDHPGKPKPEWYSSQFRSGILAELGRVRWKELNG